LTGDHGAEDVDRVPSRSADCSNVKSEPVSSLEGKESEKKLDLVTEESDTSVSCVEMSAGVRHCLCLNALPFLCIRIVSSIAV
jgi:hypothetical protein